MNVSKEIAVKMFVAVGFKSAADWKEGKIVAQLNDVDSDIVSAAKKTKTKEVVDFFTKIEKALKAKKEITLGASEAKTEEEEAAPEAEAAAPTKEKTKPAKGKPSKDKGGKEKPEKEPKQKKPGILAVIVETLTKASKTKPVTREDITAALVKQFPDRDPKGMKSTVSSQVPSGLKAEKNIVLGTDGKKPNAGFWMPKAAKA